MKKFTKLMAWAFVIVLAGCRKDNSQQNFPTLQPDKQATTFYNRETNSVEYRADNFLKKCKPPVNNFCPTPVGTNVSRIAINGNTAQYRLVAYAHNFGSHWLLWKVTGQGGTVSGIVNVNTNDASDGVPQIIDMGILRYPKDACFTLTVSGYLNKPKQNNTSCSSPVVTGLICPTLFPAL